LDANNVEITVTGTVNATTVNLNGMANKLQALEVDARSIALTGSGNQLVVTGDSRNAAPNTSSLTIGGTSNTVSFLNGFAPAGNLVLTVGDASSSGGTLVVRGSGLALGSGQELKGKGRIQGDVTLGAGSKFSPGNSPGVITVAGTAVLSGATLALEFDRTAPNGVQQDQIVVFGIASVNGGTLSLDLGKGASRFRPGADTFYPIFLSSGSAATGVEKVVSGSGFSTLVVPAGSGFSLVNGALSFTNGGFSRIGGSGNLAAVGSLVDQAFTAGVTSDTAGAASFGALMDNSNFLASTDRATVAATLSALNPGVYAELGNIGIDRLKDVQSGLGNHLDMLALDLVGEVGKAASSSPESAIGQARAWTTAYGGWGKRDADSSVGAAGYSSSNYGDISGVETKLGALTIGFTGAVGQTSATFGEGKGKVTADSWHTGFYGSVPAAGLVLDASFVYGQADSTLKRSVDVAGGGATSGKSQASEWTGQIGFAVPFRTESGSLMLTPSLHVIHASVSQDATTESSLNGLEASVNSKTTEATALRTGFQAAKLTKLGTLPTRLTASLDWVHSFESASNDVNIGLVGAGKATYRFQSSKSGQEAIRVGVGAEVFLSDRTRFRLNLDEQMKSGVNSVYGSVSIGLQF